MKIENKYKSVLSYIIGFLIEDALEAKKKAETTRDPNEKLFQEGRALAYYEVVSSIKNRLISFDISPKDVNFKISLDKELM